MYFIHLKTAICVLKHIEGDRIPNNTEVGISLIITKYYDCIGASD